MDTPSETPVDAPIAAVAVYADRARITRRARVPLPAGEQRVLIEALPMGLHADSVRVSGRGPAVVTGVDVVRRYQARTDDQTAAELAGQRRSLVAGLAEVTDADAVAQRWGDFLGNLAQRAGGSYAHALAAGTADAAGVAALGEAFTGQLTAVRARQRELAEQRERLTEELAAVDRQLSYLGQQLEPDRLAAVIGLEVTAADGEPAEVELELSYLVDGAGWEPSYDIRLDADTLTLTWYGLVTQRTGEHWPECELLLSTARPSGTVTVPELEPWYLDRQRPVEISRMPAPGAAPMAMAMGQASQAFGGYGGEPSDAIGPPLQEASSTFEQGVAAATYRPRRPVAIPADGAAHRTTLAVLDMAATLDYVTAPVRGPEAHVRAAAVNGTEHTILPGKASVFHGGDFVGTTRLSSWAPGEEVELALGIDDRIRVERDLVRRNATKAALRDTRRREVEYRITVGNHTPRPARVTVLDQVPVSRDETIAVRELRAEPAPTERTDMGVLTWKLLLGPGESAEIRLGLRVEVGKGVTMTGWRE